MSTGNRRRILEFLASYGRASKSMIGGRLSMSRESVGQNLRTMKKHGHVEIADGAGRSTRWHLTERAIKGLKEKSLP